MLDGVGAFELDNETVQLKKNQGIEITPHVAHQFRSDSGSDAQFIVVSFPKSHDDRVLVEAR
jgi:mannose-6-phosphate isomerase-like protein (cupin superfamily)